VKDGMTTASAATAALVAMIATAVALSARGAAPPGQYNYTDDGNTVYDRRTQLTWQRIVSPQVYSWDGANKICAQLALGDPSLPWRLPTKKELESLIDRRTNGPSIDALAFPNTPHDKYFWSSSPRARAPETAWAVNFNYGKVYPLPRVPTADAVGCCVRCVR
jgi:hypothetical protein